MIESFQVYTLHHLDVVISRVFHGVGNLAGSKGGFKVLYGLFNGVSGLKPEFLFYFFRGYMVGTDIIRGRGLDKDLFAQGISDHLSYLTNLIILITGVVYFPCYWLVRKAHQEDIKVGHIFDVDIGSLLIPAENGNFFVVYCMVREDVHREVQPQPGRVPAHRGRSYDHRDKTVSPLFKQDLLAKGLVLGVVGQWLQGKFLSDIEIGLYPINT
jgi:hypothetical protein